MEVKDFIFPFARYKKKSYKKREPQMETKNQISAMLKLASVALYNK